jgi:uncharacterized protein
MDFLTQPWPWYVAGVLIGLFVPVLLVLGGRQFGLSSNLRHLCAATVPANLEFFKYDWKKNGLWNLTFVVGIVLGGAAAATMLVPVDSVVRLAPATVEALRGLGLQDFSGLVPGELVSWSALTSLPGLVLVVGGGFLVGFGARWAGGCTSGHAISGLANLQMPSLVAVVGFFAGGLIVTHFILPLIL